MSLSSAQPLSPLSQEIAVSAVLAVLRDLATGVKSPVARECLLAAHDEIAFLTATGEPTNAEESADISPEESS
jgi:hypothetical protein